MKFFDADIRTSWSGPGATSGNLLVAFPTKQERPGYYGGDIVDLLERYAETDSEELAICVVIDESKQKMLHPGCSLVPLIGGFMTFGALGRRSHFVNIMQDMPSINPDFVGGVAYNELTAEDMTKEVARRALRQYAGLAVELRHDGDTFSMHVDDPVGEAA